MQIKIIITQEVRQHEDQNQGENSQNASGENLQNASDENLQNTFDENLNEDSLVISFQDLIGEKFKKNKLLNSLNAWANSKGFHFILSEGAKQLKKGVKRTFACHVKGCEYKLLLKSDSNEDNFQVEEKLSSKYKKHSKILNYMNSKEYEDHTLDFQKRDTFTEKILKEINLLKGKTQTISTLTEVLNKKFQTEFSVLQVKYQVNKILLETYGYADEDAYRFIQLAKEEASKEGFFCSKLDKNQRLFQAIYLSKSMLLYSNYFLDLVIVDATYRRNRFNLPLVNVIGVNNFGHNIMLAFGLVSNETSNAYTWFFFKLKEAWKNRKPINFIIDGSKEMREGKSHFFIGNLLF